MPGGDYASPAAPARTASEALWRTRGCRHAVRHPELRDGAGVVRNVTPGAGAAAGALGLEPDADAVFRLSSSKGAVSPKLSTGPNGLPKARDRPGGGRLRRSIPDQITAELLNDMFCFDFRRRARVVRATRDK